MVERGLGGFTGHHPAEDRETRWLTPKPIVEALGEFDLDPCGAPGHELASTTYLLENGDDGLRDPWFGRVWLNPPYGREAEPFLRRMVEHGTGTALIFARVETQMFFDHIWDKATAILFLRKRLTFLDGSGAKGKANAGAPSCLVAYGDADAQALLESQIPGRFVRLATTIDTETYQPVSADAAAIARQVEQLPRPKHLISMEEAVQHVLRFAEIDVSPTELTVIASMWKKMPKGRTLEESVAAVLRVASEVVAARG